jgi:hypothetical protein
LKRYQKMQFADLIPVLLPLMVAALYATIKYLENAAGPNPPAFDPVKFGGTMAIALVLGVFLYFTQGSVPSVEMLFAMLQAYPELVGFAVMGMVAVMDILSKLIGRTSVKVSALQAIAPAVPCTTGTCATSGGTVVTGATATPIDPAYYEITPGVSILPTNNQGKSPFTVEFAIKGSPDSGPAEVVEGTIDFGDGSPPQSFVIDFGWATVKHTYTYTKPLEGKSWSQNCFPTVTVRNLLGKEASTGRGACWVDTFDPAYSGPY